MRFSIDKQTINDLELFYNSSHKKSIFSLFNYTDTTGVLYNGIHSKTDISKIHLFYNFSFFYISDNLLDMGQIDNVEKEFLQEERPLRNGNLY